MDQRKRLIELLEAEGGFSRYMTEDERREKLADHLLSNGIVAPPVKVGQTVWVYNQSKNNVYENKVVCIKIMGASRYKNKITVEYRNQYGESSCRKYTWAQIGKQVFLTEQEAVEALAEYLRKGATDDQN